MAPTFKKIETDPTPPYFSPVLLSKQSLIALDGQSYWLNSTFKTCLLLTLNLKLRGLILGFFCFIKSSYGNTKSLLMAVISACSCSSTVKISSSSTASSVFSQLFESSAVLLLELSVVVSFLVTVSLVFVKTFSSKNSSQKLKLILNDSRLFSQLGYVVESL